MNLFPTESFAPFGISPLSVIRRDGQNSPAILEEDSKKRRLSAGRYRLF
jgi:hypothetical protein